MKKFLTIIIAAFLLQTTYAQSISVEQYEAAAAEAFEAENWSKALAYYNILIEIDSLRQDAHYMGGQSAFALRSYDTAINMWSKIPAEARTGDFALTEFFLGNAAKGKEDYAAAGGHYQAFIDSNPTAHPQELARAQAELDYTEWAAEEKSNETNINIIHLDESINTVYSDISPFVEENSLYWSRIWENSEEDYKDKDLMKVYRAIEDANAMPVAMRPEEKPQHIANWSKNAEGTRIVYTVCETEDLNCKIYQLTKGYDNSFGAPQLLFDKINMPGFQNTHPALGRDADGTELLFFASNRPGGEGGMDIWCSAIQEDGDITVPVNIPEINTVDDEITPFFQSGSQVLYFSSTGHKGMGGFDIFTSAKDGANWGEATNLGYPINGGYDETYYTFDVPSGMTHFVSNRPGAYCAEPDKDCVCNDIYRIPITVDLEVFTFNAVDNSDLLATRVELENLTTGTVDTFYINETGNDFYFPLILNQDYRVTGTKEGFSTATVDVTTKGIFETTTLRENLILAPQITLEVFTYDAISRLPLKATTVFLSDLISKSEESTVNSADSYQCSYTIDFNREYSVYATKLAYTDSDVETFSTVGINTPTKIVKELYLQPFTGLPITVYFDNDYPNPRTRQTTTEKTYDATFDRYIVQEQRFKTNYTAGLVGAEKEAAAASIEGFFRDDVQGGYDKLVKFSKTLVTYFESGTVDTIEIELQGYASPLAKSDYNQKLTERRVNSLENHFSSFQGGALVTYINSGRLRFIQSPNGENLAPTNVSPDDSNRRNSVYSPEASRERRVRIIDVQRKDGSLSFND